MRTIICSSENYRKGAPLARATAAGDGTAMQFGDVLHQVQSQAGAGDSRHLPRTVEPLKDPAGMIR